MNTQIPLPTDNYYKFCALAGVAITILSIYLPGTLGLKIEENIFELKSEIAVTKIESKYLAEEVERQSKTLDNLLTDKSEKGIRTHGKLPVPTTTKEFIAKFESAIRLNKDIEIANSKIDLKLKRTEKLLSYLIAVIIAGIIGLGVGLKLAWYGFTNWYTKIQLPLDQINSIKKSHILHTPKRD